MRIVLTVLSVLLLAVASPTLAQVEELEALTQAEEKARAEKAKLDKERAAVTREINGLKRQLAKTTRETQAFEREGAKLAAEVAAIEARLAELQARQTENRERTMELLAALQRLQLGPNQAAITNPQNAVSTAQAAQLIDSLSSELQSRAAAMTRLSEELVATREDVRARRLELEANNRELLRQRERVERLVAQKEALRADIARDAAAANAEVERLAAESATLRELIERLAEPVPDVAPSLKPKRPDTSLPVERPDGTARFADAQGGVIKPVSGALTRRFGRGEQGQTYAAPNDGQVVAPYSGRVEFAGPFKGYGRVVILNLDDGYFLLMTGMEQVLVKGQESVVRGEPIGLMPSSGPSALYLELRKNNRPIDPEPWLG